MALMFDFPNIYLNGEFIYEHQVVVERPKMNQISTTFIPDFNLQANKGYVRGEIVNIFLCNDGLVIISVLPESDTKRD